MGTFRFENKCLNRQFKLSLQSMTTKGYPCRVSLPKDIPADYDHHRISLQSMTPTGYPCRVWPPQDILAEYDHQRISLQSMTTTWYPCRVWPQQDILAEFDHNRISLQSLTTTVDKMEISSLSLDSKFKHFYFSFILWFLFWITFLSTCTVVGVMLIQLRRLSISILT